MAFEAVGYGNNVYTYIQASHPASQSAVWQEKKEREKGAPEYCNEPP
jgi:hypothetical protein